MPKRAKHRAEGPPRPNLPPDEEPQLPRGIIKEIERVLGRGPRSNDVALALSIGSAAIDEDRPDVAVEALSWAKFQAPRIATIREAYGVALYLAGSYSDALGELQAYRRMTGRTDQNHIIADCERALGRDIDRVASSARELVVDEQAPLERRVEAAIVWAGALVDHGDISGARAVLRRFTLKNKIGGSEPAVRMHYLAGELAERDGDVQTALAEFGLVQSLDAGYLDVKERVRNLG